MARRGSSMFPAGAPGAKPMALNLGLDDDDYDSDDDQAPPPQKQAPPAQKPKGPGPNHRPYVGGFAAAAFEAARDAAAKKESGR